MGKFMDLWKEKDRQRALKMLAVLSVFFMVLSVFVNYLVYRDYAGRVNAGLSGILNEVTEKYPLAEEETLLSVLNADRQGALDLSDFGIEKKEVSLLKNMKTGFYKSLFLSVPVLLVFCIFSAGIFCLYFFRENKKIGDIAEYVHAIHRKQYDLCLSENEEGVISRLKNELYKVTVMLKEEAEKNRKEKEQMKDSLADISHQIKTPMTSILVLLDNIRGMELPQEVQEKFLAEINRQFLWVNSLVISLLKLSRLDSGVVEMKKEKIDLYEFFEEIRESLSIPAETANVFLEIEENKEASFYGDGYWEREAMTNLVKNAIEHTKSGKKVFISFEETYFYTKIYIKDQGEGMEKEELEKIFDRFYSRKGAGNGHVGIGLSLAKKIIELDGGMVKADSEVGKGSAFEVRFGKNQ